MEDRERPGVTVKRLDLEVDEFLKEKSRTEELESGK